LCYGPSSAVTVVGGDEMLRTSLLDVVNSGDAWAFIGSGVSVDAGGPDWARLAADVARVLGHAAALEEDRTLSGCLEKLQYARGFSRLVKLTDRREVDLAVEGRLSQIDGPGQLHLKVTDWPFRGYITSNYDTLLEEALVAQRYKGWVPVGNTDAEIRRLSGQPEHVVWHIHGFFGRTEEEREKSRIILTEEDYDSLYLEGSRAVVQLRALLSMSRIVFFGFGFGDPEFERVLKIVGRLTSPDRPLFAIFPFESAGLQAEMREDYLLRYNVDLVPYENADRSHKGMMDLVDTYGAFCVKRGMSFGRQRKRAPSFDPETTGLMIYNELALRVQTLPATGTRDALLRARILASLLEGRTTSMSDLANEIHPRLSFLSEHEPSIEGTRKLVADVTSDLESQRLVTLNQRGDDIDLELCAEAQEIVAVQRASAELLRDQFKASIQARADDICRAGSATEVAEVAGDFIGHCVHERALGVALALGNRGSVRAFHMVALLQSLPEYMEQLEDATDATALSKLVQEVLTAPSSAEKKYIGVALQAQFAIHMLGYDPATLAARAEQVRSATYLVDSSTLIPFFARSCIGHEAASSLIRQLKGLDARLVSTPLLTTEVAEHARYALTKVDKDSGAPTPATYRASGGWAGERSNAFLDGFLREIADGSCSPSLYDYLAKSCMLKLKRKRCPDECVEAALAARGILHERLASWDGFNQMLWGDVEEYKAQIAERRRDIGTYRHERQVQAEAEALVLVQGIRSGQLSHNGEHTRNAFFISRSRVIDSVQDAASPVTVNPDALVQWISTLRACGVDELSHLTDRLLWELSENNIRVVDFRVLQRAFGPLVDASKEGLEEAKLRHAELIAERFGEDPQRAFTDTGEYEYPVVAEAYSVQAIEALQEKLEEERKRTLQASRQASLTGDEKQELERLKAEERERKRRARHKRRSIENRKRGRKKK
jgi:hypothetical protein